MTGLQYLDENLKSLIVRIIDEYHLDIFHMEDNTDGITYGPGIYFCNAFSDDFSIINFVTINGQLAINIESSKLECNRVKIHESKCYKANNAALIHANFIESVYFMKWMHDNNLVYFTKENKQSNIIPIYDENNYVPNFEQANWIISSDSISDFILSHYNSRIIPSPYLISYYHNGFKTEEQINYEEQLENTKKSLKIASFANWIAIAVGIISLLFSVILTTCCESTINSDQYKELIKTIDTNGQITNEIL